MQDPDKEKCRLCQKVLKKTSMKKHVANVHGKAGQDKKLAKALRETAKKAALNGIPSSPKVDLRSNRVKYTVPAEIDDAEMNRLNLLMADFEFIDTEENSDAPEPVSYLDAPPKRNQEEQKVQKKLEKKTGFTHMRCPAGIIDLFDPKGCQIIEIKHWKLFKYCIGQLLAYQYFYPKFMLRAHYFGPIPDDATRLMIINICQNLRIHVTWEEN